METLLKKLFSILLEQTELEQLPFNDGCSLSEITMTERIVNLELPQDYKTFLGYCNGQSDPFTLTFPPDQLVFLSFEDVVNLWTELNQESDHQFFDQFEADGKIRSVLQHPRRIPIAYNELGGAYLFLDYIPGPNGKDGQLIFNVNEVDSEVIEDNFYNLIESYVQLLISGNMVVRRQPPEFGQGYWFVSSQSELIDWAVYQKLKRSIRS